MVGMRLASIVLPAPGGPMKRMLWPPAQATSSARLAAIWPRTSRKSTEYCAASASICAASTRNGRERFGGIDQIRRLRQRLHGEDWMPSTTAASRALASGTTIIAMPLARARQALQTARREPGERCRRAKLAKEHALIEVFPKKCPWHPRRPSAMGRSNAEPSLRMSAGARLMVTLWAQGNQSRNFAART